MRGTKVGGFSMRTSFIRANGEEVGTGNFVVPDNYTGTFVVRVRSLDRVSEDRIKQLLQQKLEVLEVSQIDETCTL